MSEMISFSGGRSSAYMTNELLNYSRDNRVVCFCNTGKENDATLDFVNKCDLLWGGNTVVWLEFNPDVPEKFSIVNYETAHRTNDESKLSPFEKLIISKQFCPNPFARFCTQELKVRTIKHYLLSIGWEHWTNIVGIRYDEPRRWMRMKTVETKERWEVEMPMVAWRTVKADVNDFWKKMPFDLQLLPEEGNCDFCFLKGKNKIKSLIKRNPDGVKWWIRMEKLTGGQFHKNYSFETLLRFINASPELFDIDDTIDCFCNID